MVFGLLIAVLADRSHFETVAKALIFMPMAISLGRRGRDLALHLCLCAAGQPQIGLLNAIVVGLGGEPQAWTSRSNPGITCS